MYKYQKNKNNLIKNIIKYINSDIKLKNLFYHPNRKYKRPEKYVKKVSNRVRKLKEYLHEKCYINKNK
jgi:predicted transcriptional regulator